MTLHFRWLHAPRWMAHGHVSRAMAFVLGVIAVSTLFGVLRVLDVAVSGRLVARHGVASAPAASGPADRLLVVDPTGAGARPVDASDDVPDAAVEAISL